jgi:hypothetical protein
MITLYDLADTIEILIMAITRYNDEPSEENWNKVLMETEIAESNLKSVFPQEPDL